MDSYIAALQGVPNLGSLKIRRLLRFFKSPKEVWEASYKSLSQTGLLSSKVLHAFIEYRRNFSMDAFENELERLDIQYITYQSPLFPALLQEIYNPPVVLFYKGNIDIPSRSIGMVGARRVSTYGEREASYIGQYLGGRGVCIVSGGARGIDSASHKGALLGEGVTVAVMGSGLDVVYPRENKKLFEAIIENGCIISEYVPHTKPLAYHFPERNRIIGGLSQGLIVVEARSSSGSLITADIALQEGRDVFAIPGNINAVTSEGTNYLIKEGAIPLLDPEDILLHYGWMSTSVENKCSQQEESVITYTIEEEKVLQALEDGMVHSVDALCAHTGISIGTVSYTLLQLTLRGVVIETVHGYQRMYRR